MFIIDLNIRENLASFFERVEPDERKRDELLKILAPHICLGPVCETIEGALGYQSNEGAREWIAQWDLPEKTINAAVIRRANGRNIGIPLYTLLQDVATHLREVSIDMVKPDWGIIRHAYIEARCLAGWEAAAKQALAGKAVELNEAQSDDSSSIYPANNLKSMPARREDGSQQEKSLPWQDKARLEADKLHLRDLNAGAWSSVAVIADRVAPILRKADVLGPRGPLSAGTILREALQGNRWKRPKPDQGNPGNPGIEQSADPG